MTPLTDAVLDWVAERVGAAGQAVAGQLLRTARAREAMPLGLVLDVLLRSRRSSPAAPTTLQLAREALVRLEPRTGGGAAARAARLPRWAGQSASVVAWLLDDRANRGRLAERLLARADALLAEVQRHGLAERLRTCSRSALTARLARLAACVLAAGGPSEPRRSTIPRSRTAPRRRRAGLGAPSAAHELASSDDRVRRGLPRRGAACSAGCALDSGAAARDLRAAAPAATLDVDAWVDSAVNDAAPGVGDPELGAALAAVLRRCGAGGTVHDREFARRWPAHTADDPPAATRRRGAIWRSCCPTGRPPAGHARHPCSCWCWTG